METAPVSLRDDILVTTAGSTVPKRQSRVGGAAVERACASITGSHLCAFVAGEVAFGEKCELDRSMSCTFLISISVDTHHTWH